MLPSVAKAWTSIKGNILKTVKGKSLLTFVSIIEMKILFDLGNVTLTVKQMCQCFDRVVEVCKCGKTVLGLKLVST